MVITYSTELDLEAGTFLVSYHLTKYGEVLSFKLGDCSTGEPYVRLHSACLFGEAFLSKHCDCKDQLQNSLKKIADHGRGIIMYGFQEGRGIGIEKKIKAMEIQRVENIDTVEAFAKLGLPPDLRTYDMMIEALKDFEISKEINVISNNPKKLEALEKAGYTIKKLIEIDIELTKHNMLERSCKRDKLHYLID